MAAGEGYLTRACDNKGEGDWTGEDDYTGEGCKTGEGD